MNATRSGVLAALVMLASACASGACGARSEGAVAAPSSSSKPADAASSRPPVTRTRSALTPDEALERLLRTDRTLAKALDESERRRVQVLLAVPTSGSNGKPPSLFRSGYRVDADYFYPASAIKLCAAVAALEKLDELRVQRPQLTVSTPLRIVERGRAATRLDTTLGDELQKALVVSDNEAFNRLFDLLGPEDLGARMTRLGLKQTRVVHHVGLNAERSVGRFEWRVPRSPALVVKAPPSSTSTTSDLADDAAPGDMRLGTSYVDATGRRVPGALDFSGMNRTSLRDLQELLVAVMRPELASIAAPRLSIPDRDALIAALRTLPSELDPRATAADKLHKPILDGIQTALPGRPVRVYGKGGQAYGFTIVNAYVVDESTGRGVFVAAVVYSNDNDVMNDDRYDYVKLGTPFFSHLGVVVARVLDSDVGG